MMYDEFAFERCHDRAERAYLSGCMDEPEERRCCGKAENDGKHKRDRFEQAQESCFAVHPSSYQKMFISAE